MPLAKRHMNVTVHTLTAVAVGAFLASRIDEANSPHWLEKRDVSYLAAALVGNVLLHGLLDILPHTYPFGIKADIVLTLVLFAVTLFAVRRRYWLLFTIAILGGLLPDIVDLGPPLLAYYFHIAVPHWGIFPWHWSAYSGSLYSSAAWLVSSITHLLVIGADLGLLLACRKYLARSVLRRRTA